MMLFAAVVVVGEGDDSWSWGWECCRGLGSWAAVIFLWAVGIAEAAEVWQAYYY